MRNIAIVLATVAIVLGGCKDGTTAPLTPPDPNVEASTCWLAQGVIRWTAVSDQPSRTINFEVTFGPAASGWFVVGTFEGSTMADGFAGDADGTVIYSLWDDTYEATDTIRAHEAC